MTRPGRLAGGLAAVAIALTCAAAARAYDPITWRSVDSGGTGFVTAGAYRLGATIGQPDAGKLAGGAFTLRGGFWIGGQTQQVGVDDSPPVAGPFRFFRPTPNPVRSRSRVAFDLPRASRVALSIFDVSGRAVQRWDFGMLPAGHQERTWTAADDGGRPLHAGVYFLRLDADREQGVHKVLVVR